MVFHFFAARCCTTVQSLSGCPKLLIRVCPIHSVSYACITFYSFLEFGFSHPLSCLVNFPTLHQVFMVTLLGAIFSYLTCSYRYVTPPKKHFAATTRSKSKRPRASELTDETAKSITTPHPQTLMTVDVQALSATISLAVTQAVQQALGQSSTTSAHYTGCRGASTG